MADPRTDKVQSETKKSISAAKTGKSALAKPVLDAKDLVPDAGAPPAFQKRNLFILGGAIVFLWIIGIGTGSKLLLGLVAVLTVVVAGGLLWVWRWVRKQQNVLAIMKEGVGTKEGRAAAIAKLTAQDASGKDAVAQLAKAQLLAQDDPDAAMAALEAIDIQKAPSPIQNEIRAMRAQLYLVKDMTREARELADQITINDAPDPASRGMLTAVIAEAWARTGKSKEAADLLGAIDVNDAAYDKVRVPLLFSRVFANWAEGKKDLVKRDLRALMNDNLNYLGRFANPKAKVHPELQKITRELLQTHPEVKKMAQKTQNRAMRRMR
jgi:hypothetical protein